MSGRQGAPQSGIQSANPPQLIVLSQWKGQNNQAAQTAIDDQEVWWSENLIPLGPSNLRALWGKGPTLATAPTGFSVVSMAGWASFAGGGTAHMIAFTSNGGGVDINLSTSGVTVWPADTFWVHASTSPYSLPIPVVQWGSSGVAILAPKGMFAWDGTTLTVPGTAAPTWLTNGATTNLYAPSSGIWQVTGAESFQGRLWYSTTGTAGSLYGWSSPGNGADLTGTAGSGSATPTDPFLVSSVKSLVQGAGFLFVVGDNSLNAVNGVNTSGTPPVTTFTYANVDPQVGAKINQPPVRFGRAMAIFNEAGIYMLYGGAAQLASQKIQSLYETISATTSPTMGIAIIHGLKCVFALANVTDPFGATRNILLGTTGQEWFVATQEVPLTLIATSQIGSDSALYGTDGTNVFKLFAQPSSTLQKRLTTKSYGGRVPIAYKNFTRAYFLVQDINGGGVMMDVKAATNLGSQAVAVQMPQSSAVWTNAAGAVVTWQNSAPENVAWQLPAISTKGVPLNGWGLQCALDITTTAADFSVQQIVLSYLEKQLYGA